MFIATLAALLFAIHPQRVGSVVWIAERKGVLSLFFILLTLISYLFYVRTMHFSRYLLTLFSFLLALLSKPIAVTLPILLLLLDIYPLNRAKLINYSINTVSYKILLLEKLPFLAFSTVSIILTLAAQKNSWGNQNRNITHFRTVVKHG